MARKVYVWRDGKFLEVTNSNREVTPRTQIMTDTMPDTWHPCDGKKYDSKSAFRRVTKAHGCEELGNDKGDVAERYDSSKELKSDIIDAAKKLGYL